jgi:tryptophan-rich sensory protein
MTWIGGHWSEVLVAAAAAALVALLGRLATPLGPWYRNLRKPSWQPPDWLFGPAWTTIFACAAASGVLAWQADRNRPLVILLFAINGVLNVLWSVLFFRLRRPDWALPEAVALWLSVLAMVLAFRDMALPASLLLLPYLAWVAFAAFLNLTIVRLNRGA